MGSFYRAPRIAAIPTAPVSHLTAFDKQAGLLRVPNFSFQVLKLVSLFSVCALRYVKKFEDQGGGLMRRVVYIALLSVMAVLIFAAIAAAQSGLDRGGADQNGQGKTQSVDPSQPSDATQNNLTVSIRGHAFDPVKLDVPAKTTVTWVNEDTEPHTATSDDGKLFDSGVLQPGQSYSVWFDGSGSVTYHCKIHPDMKGTLAVGGAGGGEVTTPENTTSDTTQPVGESTQPASDNTGQTDSTQPTDGTQTTDSTQTTGNSQTAEYSQTTHTA
jgi:plastocyanin